MRRIDPVGRDLVQCDADPMTDGTVGRRLRPGRGRAEGGGCEHESANGGDGRA